jgi:iron(III) transport system permease protein
VTAPRRRDIVLFDRAAFTVCLVLLGFAVVYPAVRLAITAIGDWEWDAVLTGAGLEATINTIIIGFLSVLFAGLMGSGLAVLFTRYAFPGRAWLSAFAYLPFTLPPLVGVLSFYYLIGRDGFIARYFDIHQGMEGWYLQGAPAIVFIHAYSFYVFFYAMMTTALESMDVAQIEAARTLGAGRWRVFYRVVLPMLKPALLGASLLTFMSSGASFSAPLIFGDNYPVLSVQIFQEDSQLNEAAAHTLTVVLALVSLMGVLVFRSRQTSTGGASKGVRKVVPARAGRILVTASALLIVGVLLLPHATIVWLSFIDNTQWDIEVIPRDFTLENYTRIFSEAGAFTPIRNSLWMSAVAAVVTVAAALPAGYLIARGRPGSRLVNFLVMIPWALPGTVIAINLIVAFNDDWLPLVGTVWILPLAYFVRNVPLLTRMASAAIEPFDGQLIEAGQTLGASRWYSFTRIVLPLLAPVIASGTALVFAVSLGEFVASILLYGPGNTPIAVRVFELWRFDMSMACAYSVFLMLLVAGTFVLSRRFASRMI